MNNRELINELIAESLNLLLAALQYNMAIRVQQNYDDSVFIGMHGMHKWQESISLKVISMNPTHNPTIHQMHFSLLKLKIEMTHIYIYIYICSGLGIMESLNNIEMQTYQFCTY